MVSFLQSNLIVISSLTVFRTSKPPLQSYCEFTVFLDGLYPSVFGIDEAMIIEECHQIFMFLYYILNVYCGERQARAIAHV